MTRQHVNKLSPAVKYVFFSDLIKPICPNIKKRYTITVSTRVLILQRGVVLSCTNLVLGVVAIRLEMVFHRLLVTREVITQQAVEGVHRVYELDTCMTMIGRLWQVVTSW